ncbi:hypothetical protein AB0C76_13075 [Kitasatospora sp. NPDC048722]|uniref:hypothetical protein n=1 Tax=Kitasatospora sp. NPDC048722 TaxID=3155639 RepID=UPI0033C33511
MANPLLELAYKSHEMQLKAQADNLTSFRTRATTIFSVGALIATLSTSLGFANQKAPATLPGWTPWALLGIISAIGLASIFVLWPVDTWYSSPDADQIMTLNRLGQGEDAAYSELIPALDNQTKSNENALKWRAKCLKAGGILLLAEVITLIIGTGLR